MDAFYASVEQRDDPSLARPAGGRGRPAVASAAWWRPPATRRAGSASTRRCRARWRCAGARSSSSSGPTSEVPRGVGGGVRDLPLGHAAGRAALARRGVSRRHRERLGRGARHGGGPPDQGRDPRDDSPDGVGRRRAQQVPGQGRLGMEEARRPDRRRARSASRRSSSNCRSTRSGASDRSPPDACARPASTGPCSFARSDATCSSAWSAARPTGSCSSRTGSTTGPSSRTARPNPPAARTPSPQDLDRPLAHQGRDRGDGGRRRRLARAA